MQCFSSQQQIQLSVRQSSGSNSQNVARGIVSHFVKLFECRESIRTTFNMFWVHWHHDFGLLCIFAKKSLSRKFWSFCNFGSVLTFFVESLELFLDAGTFITTTTAPTHPWVTRASNITRSGRVGKGFCPTFKGRLGIVKNYFVWWDKKNFGLEYT